MKVYFSQLQSKLDKELAPVYLIAGNEPLQRMEASDMVRTAARTRGFTERSLFFGDQISDWVKFKAEVSNVSIFADKRLFEVILGENKPKTVASEFFKTYVEDLPSHTILLIRADKVDRRLTWVKQIEKLGVTVQVYPKTLNEMRAWLRERMLRANLKMEEHVVELISERTEGNMLAAAQEVTKLELLCEGGIVRRQDVEKFVGISSKFTVYELADAACAGDVERSLQIMYSLQIDNSPLPLVLWAIVAEIRKMITLEQRLENGEKMELVLRGEWLNRRAQVRNVLNRKLGKKWQNTLYWCAEMDKAIKGLGDDDAWNELLQLILKICGVRSLSKRTLVASRI